MIRTAWRLLLLALAATVVGDAGGPLAVLGAAVVVVGVAVVAVRRAWS